MRVFEGMLLHDFKLELSHQVFFYHETDAVLDSFNVVWIKLSGIVSIHGVKHCSNDAMPTRDQSYNLPLLLDFCFMVLHCTERVMIFKWFCL